MSMASELNGNSNGFFVGNQHSDILKCSVPDTPEGAARLIEEIKRRGNSAFKASSFMEADVLYSRAIQLNSSNAALLTNRSMTRANMGRFEEALSDAEESLKVDSKWEKGYYRKALAEIALNQFDSAEASLIELLKLNPDNKAGKSELSMLGKRRSEALAFQEREQQRKNKPENEIKRTVISKKVINSADLTKQVAAKKKQNDSNEKDLSMRGYHTLSDGRKTTFFNRELSEEDKALIAKNAGPTLVDSAADIAAKEATKLESGASVWNQGGTFEEKSMSDWALDRLKEKIVGIELPIIVESNDGKTDEAIIKVISLADLEGDASITFSRGKRRHVFDFNFSAEWEVEISGTCIKGCLFFPDVSGDVVVNDDVVEFELRWSDRERAGINQVELRSALENKKEGLAALINVAVHAFAKEFREIS